MADNSDFMALYDELGMDADCSMEQLTLRWRRRVRQLHPDRAHSCDETGQTLQLLNARFRQARRFHRQHGRLPGSRLSGGTRRTAQAMVTRRQSMPKRAQRATLWLITPLALLLLWSYVRAQPLPHATGIAAMHPCGFLQP